MYGPWQIRFDLPTTLLAFIQSRGRARVLASHMVLMLQAGNAAQSQLVSEVKSCAVCPAAPTVENILRAVTSGPRTVNINVSQLQHTASAALPRLVPVDLWESSLTC
jgi:hypothetical protein